MLDELITEDSTSKNRNRTGTLGSNAGDLNDLVEIEEYDDIV